MVILWKVANRMTTTSDEDLIDSKRPIILLATENQGKVRELQALLGPDIEVHDMSMIDVALPEEVGTTFAENAIAKAMFASERTGLVALADDSGLEVNILDGLPGVRTARYAGDNATDAENRQKLLGVLKGIAPEDRSARFVSVIAIVVPGHAPQTFTGYCEGRIGDAERGTGGFGYDSIFVLPDGRTMAELSPEEKNAISHRGAAMRQAVPVVVEQLRAAVASGNDQSEVQ
jgi:XTP/dITP diphosphohydrolase